MALSQRDSRDLIVGAAEATETTIGTFQSAASADEVKIFTAQGANPTGVAPFIIAQKRADGTLKKSRTIDPASIQSVRAVKKVAESQQTDTFALTGTTIEVGVPVKLEIRVFEAGAASTNQWQNFIAEFVPTTTSQQDLADGLVAAFNSNMLKYPGATASANPLLSVTRGGSGATSTLVVAGVEQALKLGQDEGKAVQFNTRLYTLNGDSETTPLGAKTEVAAVPGVGTLKQVKNMEFFHEGQYGDHYRHMGYPNSFPSVIEAGNAAGYNLIEILYKQTGEQYTTTGVFGSVTIAIAEGANPNELVEVNKVINNLEVVTGLTIADLA